MARTLVRYGDAASVPSAIATARDNLKTKLAAAI